jgi:hypothetical protein
LPAPTPALSPKAAERVSREAAVQPYDRAAEALKRDWGVGYDGKQIERWGMKLGGALVDVRAQEVKAYERGIRPQGPTNDPVLLVLGLDGGRVQGREKDPDTGNRWREDKVLSITSYLPGDGQDKAPEPLVTTYVATMENSQEFGKMARVEAERRGIRQAPRVINISDGAGWIDTQHEEHFGRHERIVDYYHAVEHLHDVAKAVHPQEEALRKKLASDLKNLLWEGQTAGLITVLRAYAAKLGPVEESDGPEHPRRVLIQNLGYFTKHQQHMNYPQYRKRGWPIGSGSTEAGVKQFNKRVKGTEQFWSQTGVEPILALRALWLSQDDRWDHYWLCGHLSRQAA